ncbi:EamA family transporter [Bradyrhizobium ivorense]|uniref:EamA family transporter n=1 Tax=Bradyrhizobium ivorense TaxID=2511166 RepID=UPI00111CB5FD
MIIPVVLRVAGEVGGTILLLAAIVNLPLANATAIIQVLPLAITLGAALTFGESVGWRRWLAIAAGFIGVLIVVRPGVEGFDQFSLSPTMSRVFDPISHCDVRASTGHPANIATPPDKPCFHRCAPCEEEPLVWRPVEDISPARAIPWLRWQGAFQANEFASLAVVVASVVPRCHLCPRN